jgi:hypothetical protein
MKLLSKRIQGAVAASLLMATGLLVAATAFDPADQPVGYVAQVELTNYDLRSGQELAFRTEYQRDSWNGNVFAYNMTPMGEVASHWWDGGAAAQIAQQDTNTGRFIVTQTEAGVAVPFRWASLSPSQQASLGDATTGPRVLSYIRGNRSAEKQNGGTFRDRVSVLGDVLHSRPFYYSNGGTPILFVGANDGMLHVLDASKTSRTGGKELWAYIPRTVVPNLSALTQDPYTHRYYVDGGINVAPVTLPTGTQPVLVGGLGAGGRAYFALNVASPIPTSESSAASRVLWEVSNSTAGYGNLGYTYSAPIMASVNSGGGQTAVIVGNGYNSGAASSLFVMDARDGTLIREIVTGGSTGGGLSSPTCVDINRDKKADYCYAGDIDGKLWKFDLSSKSPADWKVTLIHTTNPAQAITTAPAVARHPSGGYMVSFATGKILTTADKADRSTHYAYGIWDGAPASNTSILSQTLVERSYVNGTSTERVRVSTDNVPRWSPTPTPCADPCVPNHRGWRVALPRLGERVTGDATLIENGRFYFSSTNPTVTATAPTPNGENWLMELDYLTGGAINEPFFDLNRNGVLNDEDRVVYVAGDAIPSGRTVGQRNLEATGVPVGRYMGPGVISQPVLVQLAQLNTTLFNTNPDMSLQLVSSTSTITTETSKGVSGGHFDVDIYYAKYDGNSKAHTHEYDDKYDVTGVNMLNASDPQFNLSNAISGKGTPFKVLVHNQYLSPAVTLSVGGATHTSVKLYNDQAKETVAANVIANAPTYSLSSPNFTLEFKMPVNAFVAQDWWTLAGGTGFVAGTQRVGLQPTQTKCVKDAVDPDTFMFNGVTPPANSSSGPGTNGWGARHNGALTIQVIKANTTASQIEMNVSGRPEYGWRVNAASFSTQVLAEYTVFWHHPNKLCYGDAGWTSKPPMDFDDSGKSEPRAVGSDDPLGTDRSGIVIVSVTTRVDGDKTIVTTTYSDGTTQTSTYTGGGGSTGGDGWNPRPSGGGGSGGGLNHVNESAKNPRTGRISWGQLLRN